MKFAVIAVALLSFSSPGFAQTKPVCDVFTDAEITDLLGKPATVKRAVVGPETCLWGLMGFMFNVSRTTDDEPEVIKAVVDARATNPRGDVVTPEPGIGDQAVSIQGQYGRSAQIVFRAGKSAWVLNLEKVDQKLDVAAALPKLRALAKKAAAVK